MEEADKQAIINKMNQFEQRANIMDQTAVKFQKL